MHRGSTPSIRFEFDRDISAADAVEITFSQDGEIVLNKYLSDCVVGTDTIDVYMSEDETLMFKTDEFYNAYIEAQIKLGYGPQRVISNIMQIVIKPILKDGPMGEDPNPKDPNLKPENIKKGIVIDGVTGTAELK